MGFILNDERGKRVEEDLLARAKGREDGLVARVRQPGGDVAFVRRRIEMACRTDTPRKSKHADQLSDRGCPLAKHRQLVDRSKNDRRCTCVDSIVGKQEWQRRPDGVSAVEVALCIEANDAKATRRWAIGLKATKTGRCPTGGALWHFVIGRAEFAIACGVALLVGIEPADPFFQSFVIGMGRVAG